MGHITKEKEMNKKLIKEMNEYFGCEYIVDASKFDSTKEDKPKWRYRKNKDGFMGSENRILEKEDKPEEGKVYALTGGPNDKCIANGNSWSESEVKDE